MVSLDCEEFIPGGRFVGGEMRKLLFLGAMILVGLSVDGCRENMVGPAPVQQSLASPADTLSKRGFPSFAGDTLSNIRQPESVSPVTRHNSEFSSQKEISNRSELSTKPSK